MALYNGNAELGARLIMYDFLDATLCTWFDFLELVRRRGVWRPRSNYEELEEKVPAAGDREHVVDFAKATRDLANAMETTTSAIKLVANFDTDRQKAFDYLLLKNHARTESLRNIVKDIEDYMDAIAARAERLTNERQESSLKRLTLVASVFLPLTMACSLLSMNNRVNEIGAVWWDWLGIVVILTAIIINGYRITSAIHNVRQQTHLRWILRAFKDEYRKAKRRALKKRAEKKNSDQKSLVPFFPKFMFRISKYIFIAGATASFLIGMFVNGGDVATGAESLGYSAAGTFGIAVLGIILWRLAKATLWMIRHSRSKDDEDDAESKYDTKSGKLVNSAMGRYRKRSERRRVEKKGATKKKSSVFGRILRKVGLFCCCSICYPLTIFLASTTYSVFIFFFGSLIFDVVWELAKKLYHVGMAGFLRELWGKFMEGMNEAKFEQEMEEMQKMANEKSFGDENEDEDSEMGSGTDHSGEDTDGGEGKEGDVEKEAGKQANGGKDGNRDGAEKRAVDPGDPTSPVPGIKRVDTWGGMKRGATMQFAGSRRQLRRHRTSPVAHGMETLRPVKRSKTSGLRESHNLGLNRVEIDTPVKREDRMASGEAQDKNS